MDKISASDAKQKFGDLLRRALSMPVAIEKHGKVVAALVPAEWLKRDERLDDRHLARKQQRQLEQNRLMAHQRIGIDLLARTERRKELLKVARAEVRRWSENNLCSQDYIDRWSQWLALPPGELVIRMCSDADGWGNAMRQNSPFGVALR
jgi:prevent-host-death family protein